MASRKDPRVDSNGSEDSSSDDHSVERVVVPTHIQPPPSTRQIEVQEGKHPSSPPTNARARSTPPPAMRSSFVDPSAPTAASALGPTSVPAPSSPASAPPPPTLDPMRLERISQRLDANDWKGITDELGSLDDELLPKAFALIAAIAHNEHAPEGHPKSIGVASRAVSQLLGVPIDSPVTRILARRLLRKNALRFRDRPAPRARWTALILVATLLVGSGIGLFASGGWALIRPLIFGH